MTQNTVNELQGQLTAYMERKGLRSTSQRRLVSDTFFRAAGHHSIDDVLAMVRAKDPKVGYATVYRTMKLLVKCGLANERQFGETDEGAEIASTTTITIDLRRLQAHRRVRGRRDRGAPGRPAKRYGFSLLSHA
jgi:Fur family ferric uptake transcriptional regulator